jgi:hypothetical protein
VKHPAFLSEQEDMRPNVNPMPKQPQPQPLLIGVIEKEPSVCVWLATGDNYDRFYRRNEMNGQGKTDDDNHGTGGCGSAASPRN